MRARASPSLPAQGSDFPPSLPVSGDYTIIPALPISARCLNAAGLPIEPPPTIHLLVTGNCGS